MSVTADNLLDDYWFVLARTGRARGSGTGSSERLAPPAMRSTLLNAVRRKPQVMVKITSFASSKERLAAHLDYISRKGQHEVLDPAGDAFSAIGGQMRLSARDAIQHYGRELATGPIDEVETGKKKMGRPRKRVSMNLMLSMPAGTETGAFELAVRDFLNDQFQAHDRLFTFHDDRDHYHAHVVIGLQGADGRWLNPRKNDLLAWRERFAASLERYGIAAEAWTRIANHYATAGDQEAADAIRDYVADHYDYQSELSAHQEQAKAPRPEPPAKRRKPPRDQGRER